jgi:hypothetical protein
MSAIITKLTLASDATALWFDGDIFLLAASEHKIGDYLFIPLRRKIQKVILYAFLEACSCCLYLSVDDGVCRKLLCFSRVFPSDGHLRALEFRTLVV